LHGIRLLSKEKAFCQSSDSDTVDIRNLELVPNLQNPKFLTGFKQHQASIVILLYAYDLHFLIKDSKHDQTLLLPWHCLPGATLSVRRIICPL
jgi:hypothetical protein